jgi:hypothetical protein
MRRLAKQDREDDYGSRRDYQEIEQSKGVRLFSALEKLNWAVEIAADVDKVLFGAGGFVRSPAEIGMTLRVSVGGKTTAERRYSIGDAWVRIGASVEVDCPATAEISLLFDDAQEYVDVWGLAAGVVDLAGTNTDEMPAIGDVDLSHLVPETFYLNHNDQLPNGLLGFDAQGDGAEIALKKCSYCGRHLPLGPGTAGRLSFHKHNAKLSGHQNECRSCKKWRINDAFNPLRTTDQLNESSVITRERRILLREAVILQTIKERQGRGLKSIVWDRFGRKCFYCEKPLALKEVQLDHTRPLAYLWPIDEHATCLCAEHNNHKKDRFPVDFYTEDQLVKLSDITGMALDELKEKSICQPELQRIRNNLVDFAQRADARAFNAIARKVLELNPDVDLWAELAATDKETFDETKRLAAVRPAAVIDKRAATLDAELDALED